MNRPQPHLLPARPRPAIRVRLEVGFDSPAAVDTLHRGQFCANGETHLIDWLNNPSDDLEWHIMLHKFHHAPVLVDCWWRDGNEQHLDLLERHIAEWTRAIPPGFIAADVTGRRIRNWVYTLALLDDARPALSATMESSLREQVIWLRRNLHARRNHRTLELFAIFIAGIWLGESEWQGFAMGELLANAGSDFLPDGVHIELSSHYHCIVLRNFIEAIELADDNGLSVPSELRGIVDRASHFARALHKPDGTIPALSDADTGDYRAMLGKGVPLRSAETFPDGGYVILRDRKALRGEREGSFLVLDCGDIGAGNHGHIDSLNFEFAACGRSLIVDPGRYTYHEGGETNWRAAFRRTRAHNVVQVDQAEQTLYHQGLKRMKIGGPAPVTKLLAQRDLGHISLVQASAVSAQYPVVHQRSVMMHGDGWCAIHDRLDGPEEHLYEALFQLEPLAQDKITIVELAKNRWQIRVPDLTMLVQGGGAIELSVEQGWVSPRYGERHAAPRVVVAQRARSAWFCTLLQPGEGCDRPLRFDATPDSIRLNEDFLNIPHLAAAPRLPEGATC